MRGLIIENDWNFHNFSLRAERLHKSSAGLMLSSSFLILVLGVFIVPSLVFAACLQGDLLNENSNRCYKFVEGPLSFALAEEHCQEFGGHLVSISNGFESVMIFEAVEKTFGNLGNAWIGANKLTQSGWSWIDGLSFSFTNWGPGAGNQHVEWKCAVISTNNGMWYDVPCASEVPFVCAYPPVSSPEVRTSTAPPVIPSHCDSTWTYYSETDSCYGVGHHQNFDDAEADCNSAEAHLTSVHSKEENEFVNVLASTGFSVPNSTYMTAIGLFQTNNIWAWTDGSEVDYVNWLSGQPDDFEGEEHCAQTWSDNEVNHPTVTLHQWNDVACEFKTGGSLEE